MGSFLTLPPMLPDDKHIVRRGEQSNKNLGFLKNPSGQIL